MFIILLPFFSTEFDFHLDHNIMNYPCMTKRVVDGKRTFVVDQYNYKCIETQSSNLVFF